MAKTDRPRFSWLYVIPTVIALIGGIFIGMNIVPGEQQAANPTAESGQPDAQQPPVEEPEIPEPAAAQEQTELPELARNISDDPAASGDEDAPIVMAVFSDYQCPFCVKWANETLPEIQEYVDEGKVRLEYRNLALFGQGSQSAALGAYAAGLQGKFDEFSEKVFEPGNVRPDDELSADGLTKLAGEIGLDEDQFREDIESDQVAGAVAKHQAEAQSLGVTSTPTFVVNKRPVIGAQPSEVFIMTIEAELEALGE